MTQPEYRSPITKLIQTYLADTPFETRRDEEHEIGESLADALANAWHRYLQDQQGLSRYTITLYLATFYEGRYGTVKTTSWVEVEMGQPSATQTDLAAARQMPEYASYSAIRTCLDDIEGASTLGLIDQHLVRLNDLMNTYYREGIEKIAMSVKQEFDERLSLAEGSVDGSKQYGPSERPELSKPRGTKLEFQLPLNKK